MRFPFMRVALLSWMLIGLARIATCDEHAGPSTKPSDQSAPIVAEFGDDDGTMISSAFSPDGKFVVTASVNRNVVVWDWHAKQAVLSLHGKGDLAFIMPDNRTLAVSNTGVLSTWDLITGKTLRQLADLGAADCVAPTGRDGELLCGGRFGELSLCLPAVQMTNRLGSGTWKQRKSCDESREAPSPHAAWRFPATALDSCSWEKAGPSTSGI
jgi:hypothetical protein